MGDGPGFARAVAALAGELVADCPPPGLALELVLLALGVLEEVEAQAVLLRLPVLGLRPGLEEGPLVHADGLGLREAALLGGDPGGHHLDVVTLQLAAGVLRGSAGLSAPQAGPAPPANALAAH